MGSSRRYLEGHANVVMALETLAVHRIEEVLDHVVVDRTVRIVAGRRACQVRLSIRVIVRRPNRMLVGMRIDPPMALQT